MRIRKTKKDPRKIDVTSWRDLRNFAMTLQVSEEDVRAAVAQVGDIVDDVRKHLKSFNNPYLHRAKGWRL